jgi:hypothetical protein
MPAPGKFAGIEGIPVQEFLTKWGGHKEKDCRLEMTAFSNLQSLLCELYIWKPGLALTVLISRFST